MAHKRRRGLVMAWYEYSDTINMLCREGRYSEAAGVARVALEKAERRFGSVCPYTGWQLGRLVEVLTHLTETSRWEVRVPREFAEAA